MYKKLIRPLLFKVDPETIHHSVFSLFKLAQAIPGVIKANQALYSVQDARLSRRVFGIDFPNPVGLAAGFDKEAEVFDMLGAFGFGFVEIGTITPKGQAGNPLPRLFRLKEDQALINRMGFNNKGLEAAIENLKARRSKVIVGGNIGKNKATSNEEAISDYEECFEGLFPVVDYFVVNVSSPNTPNLRELQDKEPLEALLTRLKTLNSAKTKPKPILLKIAPDLTDTQLDDVLEIVRNTRIDGIVATNTTISREGLSLSKEKIAALGAGGLSGKPLRDRATEVIRYLHQGSNGEIPIVGVGGIMTVEDALEKLEAGASLIQLYTGFVYEGPGLVKKINQALLQALNH